MEKDILKDEKVELKPCPFCGSEADFGEKIYKRSRSIVIGCTNNKCFCRFSLKLSNQTKPENFIRIFKQLTEKWNKREDEKELKRYREALDDIQRDLAERFMGGRDSFIYQCAIQECREIVDKYKTKIYKWRCHNDKRRSNQLFQEKLCK